MPKSSNLPANQPEILKGWQQISAFFGEPVSVIQRWASEGMPVRHEGRFVVADSEELTDWLGK
jgi:phage terminase Nu1 subunit (DNA packaging protein)